MKQVIKRVLTNNCKSQRTHFFSLFIKFPRKAGPGSKDRGSITTEKAFSRTTFFIFLTKAAISILGSKCTLLAVQGNFER